MPIGNIKHLVTKATARIRQTGKVPKALKTFINTYKTGNSKRVQRHLIHLGTRAELGAGAAQDISERLTAAKMRPYIGANRTGHIFRHSTEKVRRSRLAQTLSELRKKHGGAEVRTRLKESAEAYQKHGISTPVSTPGGVSVKQLPIYPSPPKGKHYAKRLVQRNRRVRRLLETRQKPQLLRRLSG